MIRYIIRLFIQELLNECEKRYGKEFLPLGGPVGGDEDDGKINP